MIQRIWSLVWLNQLRRTKMIQIFLIIFKIWTCLNLMKEKMKSYQVTEKQAKVSKTLLLRPCSNNFQMIKSFISSNRNKFSTFNCFNRNNSWQGNIPYSSRISWHSKMCKMVKMMEVKEGDQLMLSQLFHRIYHRSRMVFNKILI
jgi:hypothetical protein